MGKSDEVRRLLDERGVEYTAYDEEHIKETCWSYMGELTAGFAEYDNGTTRFACDTWCFTPEQAIAATVGNVGYGIVFADWCEFPPETMVGETVFDSEGNAIGWITNATVGRETLTAEQVRECVKGVYFEGYGDGATHRVHGIEETDWQTIADKLNATLGAGTCKLVIEKRPRHGPWIYHFGCGYDFWQPTDCPMPIFRHCPNCGKRIKEDE